MNPKPNDAKASPGAKKTEMLNDLKKQKDWYQQNLAKNYKGNQVLANSGLRQMAGKSPMRNMVESTSVHTYKWNVPKYDV